MQVLQGKYLEQVTSKKGNIKALKIETPEGVYTIYLPKALSVIVKQELVLGDMLRVWSIAKGTDTAKRQRALQIIPLHPQTSLPAFACELTNELTETAVNQADDARSPEKSKRKKSKRGKSERGKSKKKAAKKQMTVQLCQKKNCCKKGGTKLWQTFEQVANSNSLDQPTFALEAVGCLGGCKKGPNLRVLPANIKYYHVQPDDVEALLSSHKK
ncbi:MAG: (2Fe-2S) ferredoxin domain-containing protein [Cyanobacteria bacterium J06554_11]